MMPAELLNDSIVKRRTLLWHMGERFAAQRLLEQGWTIINRNWKAGRYEIDIIALSPEQLLVFIEVKTRITSVHPGVSMYGLESITHEKRQRLVAAANIYMHHNELVDRGARLDVVVVSYPRKTRSTQPGESTHQRPAAADQSSKTDQCQQKNVLLQTQLQIEDLESLDETTLKSKLDEPLMTHIYQAFY